MDKPFKFAQQSDRIEKIKEQVTPKLIIAQSDRSYQRLYISLKEHPSIKSSKISIQSIGGNSVSIQSKDLFQRKSGAAEGEGKLACYEFGVEINLVDHLRLIKEDRQLFISTKVITVYPRYVIVNKTAFTVSVIQPKTMFSSPLIVEPNERIPFYWKNSQLK